LDEFSESETSESSVFLPFLPFETSDFLVAFFALGAGAGWVAGIRFLLSDGSALIKADLLALMIGRAGSFSSSSSEDDSL